MRAYRAPSRNNLSENGSFIAVLLDRPTGDRSDEQAHGRSPGSRAYRRRRLPGSRSSGVRRRHAADSRGGGHGLAKPTVFPFHPLRQRDRARLVSQLRGVLSNRHFRPTLLISSWARPWTWRRYSIALRGFVFPLFEAGQARLADPRYGGSIRRVSLCGPPTAKILSSSRHRRA